MSLEQQAKARLDAALGKLDEALQSVESQSSEVSQLVGEMEQLKKEREALRQELDLAKQVQAGDRAIDDKLDQAIAKIETVLSANGAGSGAD